MLLFLHLLHIKKKFGTMVTDRLTSDLTLSLGLGHRTRGFLFLHIKKTFYKILGVTDPAGP
jgi:hypothetical protein